MKNFREFLSEAKKKHKKPKILERLINQLKDKGFDVGAATAIATKQQQKAGNIKKGSQELTKKGKKRQKMGAAGRAKDRAAKRSGRKPSEYKYNARNNQASLKEELMFESLLAEGTRHIFSDFDGTLADDQSMVKVGDRKFTGVEFSSYVAKPGDPKPDFSEFKQLNKPKIEGKHFSFKVFKNAASKLAKKKEAGHKDLPVLAIVTARPPDVVPHMRQWLKDNGVDNADDVHIHAVGSSDPNEKVKAIRSHITSGRVKHGDQIHFFDDHGPNVEAIHGMREDHPEINIRSVQVGPHRKKGK
jgi:hypothetical protein